VEKLYHLLATVGRLNIRYDAKKMTGGQPIGAGLQRAIEECRGMVLIASPEAITRGWVKAEIDIARSEQADSPDFRIVPLRVGTADVASVLKGQSWIDIAEPTFNATIASSIFAAFYPEENRPDPRMSRHVYLSASWHSSDNSSAIAVSKVLAKAGFRLIGDSKDQKGFKKNRIESLVRSCGALVAVVPFRESNVASATEKPYKYFISEIDIASSEGLPALVIADPRIRRSDGDDESWLRMDTNASECSSEISRKINDLWDAWGRPSQPHEIFFATELGTKSSEANSAARILMERVTGMPTIVGSEIHEPDLQLAITERIKKAFLVVADITGSQETDFNLDVCIEAGMAIATETNFALITKGHSRRPPFMLRRAGQLMAYSDEAEFFGVLHKLVRDYRRRVINSELAWY
jgi:hypothetical protein